jgi:hypothetical protein
MTGRKYIVDIRRHRGLNSSYAVELVGRFCSGSPGAVVEWLVRPDQAHLIPPDHIIGQADPLDHSWTTRICERLVQLSATQNGGTGTPVWVLSYDNLLLAQAQKLNTEKQHITSVHLGELYKMNVPSLDRFPERRSLPRTFRNGSSRVTRDHFRPDCASATSSLSMEEAIALVKRILRDGGYTSSEHALPQKELRPRMSGVDSRAARQPGHPASENLIADLVDGGLQEGWLKRFRGVPGRTGTELIYLNEEVAASSGVAGSTASEATQLVGSQQNAGPAVATSAAVDSTRGIVVDRQPVAIVEQTMAVSLSQMPKRQNRATKFEAALSKSRIGAIPETRELLFDAVEGIVSDLDGELVLVTELFSRAVKRAQEKAAEAGYTSEKNWPTAERCIRRLMLWAGVLIGEEEEPIADKIGSNSRRLVKLAPDFRRKCEAYLMEHIIEKLGDIKYDDDPYYLGLTLFRRGKERAVAPEELKDKADVILVYLEENGRIEMDTDRVVRIKSGSKMFAIAK